MITPSFYLALGTYVRQSEQSVGIMHETALQHTVYKALENSLDRDGVVQIIAGHVQKGFDNIVKEYEIAEAKELFPLKRRAKLHVAILEELQVIHG